MAAIRWLSPGVCISLCDIRAIGHDGEEYRWNRFYVSHYRDGLSMSCLEFDADDEDAAFAYAESLVAQKRKRLKVSNRASVAADGIIKAVRTEDAAGAAAFFSDSLNYDDRRRLGGNAVTSRRDYLSSIQRIVLQYNRFDNETLAVRGERLALVASFLSDSAGNESGYLHVYEVDSEGLVTYEGRFDADDYLGAYAELERRYCDGDGAEWAESARAAAGWVEGIGRRDIELARRFSTPDFRWIAPASSLKDRERTVEDMFAWFDQRAKQVSAQRHRVCAMQWVSPMCAVALIGISAVGREGEEYAWESVVVGQYRSGRVASVHEFDTEEEAFSFAEAAAAHVQNRLAVANRASAASVRILAAMQARDLDACADYWADRFDYDDRRTLSGEPLSTRAEMREALARIFVRYNTFECQTLAVRGERINLARLCWSDGDGNQSASLTLGEVDADDRLIYEARFDEEDFETAYAELERRYYAGEGAEFADVRATLTDLVIAGNRGDLDTVFGELFSPDIAIESRSRTIIPNRTLSQLRSSYKDFNAMVASSRVWNAAVHWLSPTCVAVRQEREAIGLDGGKYEWSRIYVGESHGGRVTALCEFDVEQEEEAFAYAEERMRAATSRLAVANRASAAGERLAGALGVGDLDLALAQCARECVHDDRRGIRGDPIVGDAAMRSAFERVVQQYNRFTATAIAVRGDRLALGRGVRSDEAGNESTLLIVAEVDDDDRLIAYSSFDEDDFEGAYAELERRYFAGEGAPIADSGARMTAFVTAVNRGDMDAAFGLLKIPDLRIETRSDAVFPERSLTELRADLDQLFAMTAGVRWWYSAVCWLSPTCCVARQERTASGAGGESYAWTDIYAMQFDGGAVNWVCRFNLDDEEQAFAAAEDRVRLSRSRLATVNQASRIRLGVTEAIERDDIDAAAGAYADDFAYEDHRRLSGDVPLGRVGIRAAFTRLRRDYTHFGGRFLAVRGERLALGEYVCSDEAGNRMTGLTLTEITEDGRICFEGRFDDDDFESAYRELSRRYSAGEGSLFAELTRVATDYFTARNRGDFDTLFASLASPDFRIESRSGSVFVARSAAEHRASLEELAGLVVSARDWTSAVCPLSPTWAVARNQREAVGLNGEDYQWDRIAVAEIRDGRLTAVYDFDLADEEEAFRFAEERARASETRLPVRNRAADARLRMTVAFRAGHADAVADCYRDDYLFEDRRRLSGEPLCGKAALKAAVERILAQYSDFEWRVLAVRGDCSALYWSRWRDQAGNETAHLHLVEVDDDGLIRYEGRFDDDDFETAYGELERRHYAGEGAPFAQFGNVMTDYFTARNRGDLDTAFGALTSPDFRLETRSGSVFLDRTGPEHRASVEALRDLVGTVREWMSAIHVLSPSWGVGRYQREATGPDGEAYQWDRICVAEVRDGRLTYVCDFDLDDEAAAFAFAEERARASASRLPLTNRAAEAITAMFQALSRADTDSIVDSFSDDYVRDDRRRILGSPLREKSEMRSATERMLKQFNRFQWRTLAVRGERLALGWTHWSDDAGNVSAYLAVGEVDDEGLISYEARFDEDDFDSANRELERRYFAGEGTAFAANEDLQSVFIEAVNRRDLEAARKVCLPSIRIVSPPAMLAAEERSLEEFVRWLDERAEQAPSVRHWLSAVRWLSAQCEVIRIEIRALGADGDDYSWPRIAVGEIRGGRMAHIRQFDLDDEDAAFAYAEEIVAKHASRLPSTNVAGDVGEAALLALKARDVNGFSGFYADDFLFDDHRRLNGGPIRGTAAMRAAAERILSQFTSFELRGLAVRGARLALGGSRWSDAAGNESRHLHLVEVDPKDRIIYDGRFDEDDFEAAYAEMERRYYSGEGAAFAETVLPAASYMGRHEPRRLHSMFNELTRSDFRIENRSRSAFPDRSATELREQPRRALRPAEVPSAAVTPAWPGIPGRLRLSGTSGRASASTASIRVVAHIWWERGATANSPHWVTSTPTTKTAPSPTPSRCVECAISQASTRTSSAEMRTRRTSAAARCAERCGSWPARAAGPSASPRGRACCPAR